MILIGLGGNLDRPRGGPPRETLAAALDALAAMRIAVVARSGWYASEPVPRSDQPWFVNAVAALSTGRDAVTLLAALQSVEARLGRVRGARNAARIVDLDLLDYNGQAIRTASLTLPHPRLHMRRFVLMPLAEIAPEWRHPIFGSSARELLEKLGGDHKVERLRG